MPALTKIDETGAAVGETQLDDHLVEAEANIGLLHDVVRAEMASYRQGTHKAKTRGEVNGGGAKPWRQKGTGRARAGSSRIPHWTGGGVAFPPTPRDHSFKVNKKARAKAFRQALGNLVENGNVRVLESLEFDMPSTRRAAAILANSGLRGPYLVVAQPLRTVFVEVDAKELGIVLDEGQDKQTVTVAVTEIDPNESNLLLSFRNLPDTVVRGVGDVEVHDYIQARSLVYTETCLNWMMDSGETDEGEEA
jgi:large subunit ribosomal protein L4